MSRERGEIVRKRHGEYAGNARNGMGNARGFTSFST